MSGGTDALVAEIAANFQRLREFEAKLATTEITVTSPERNVRMTCDASGTVRDIQFNRSVPRDVDVKRLGREIAQTLNSARTAGGMAREKFLNGLEMGGEKVGDRLRHPVTADEALRDVFGE